MPSLPKKKDVSWRAKTERKAFESKGKKSYKTDNVKFYNSKEWKTLRNYYISEFPLCKWCEEEDKIVPGDVVDHIKEIKDGGDILNQNNLMTLCHRHHIQKTNWERSKRKRRNE
mgnify:CR=1 FL=1|tara:strand:+ start:3714 stop:4055 length:342 start_codon:yes stop_codon:yes gene_type:complete